MGPENTALSFSDMLMSSKMWRLSALTALNRFVMALRLVVLPLYVLAIGSDEAFYGLLIAGAGYAEGIFLPVTGIFSDKKGRGRSILVGGLITGSAFFAIPFVGQSWLLLAVYCVTGIGDGFIVSSVEAMIADHSRSDDERTKSYGFTIAMATLAATIGPFLCGALLDEAVTPWISPEMLRYIVIFFMMGGARVTAGVLGFQTEKWLFSNETEARPMVENEALPEVIHSVKGDTRTALLFGLSQLIMGVSSGMVVPFLIPWVNARFLPDKLLLGAVPAIANLTLASGTLLVGLVSERFGKIRTVLFLYLLAPLLAWGLVASPYFLMMAVFFIARDAVANMVRPATNSLFMGEVTGSRRGRLWAITRVMWTFPRQTGTLLTSVILAWGLFPSIVEFGIFCFPLAMLLYPICVIPMYLAVKRNRAEQMNADQNGPRPE